MSRAARIMAGALLAVSLVTATVSMLDRQWALVKLDVIIGLLCAAALREPRR